MTCPVCRGEGWVCDGVRGDVSPCYARSPGVRAELRARRCPSCSDPRLAVIVPGVRGIPTAALVWPR